MDMEFKENNFTQEQWKELDEELDIWTRIGFTCKWGTTKSTEPVDIYLEQMYGQVNKVSYHDVDFRDNKLVCLTANYIYKRHEYENLHIVNFCYLLRQGDQIKGYARYCPDCNMFKISGTKKRWDRRFERLEELCEMYLKSIGVWERYN